MSGLVEHHELQAGGDEGSQSRGFRPVEGPDRQHAMPVTVVLGRLVRSDTRSRVDKVGGKGFNLCAVPGEPVEMVRDRDGAGGFDKPAELEDAVEREMGPRNLGNREARTLRDEHEIRGVDEFGQRGEPSGASAGRSRGAP